MGVNYAVRPHSPSIRGKMPQAWPSRGIGKAWGQTHSWLLENLPELPTWDSGGAGTLLGGMCTFPLSHPIFATVPQCTCRVCEWDGGLTWVPVEIEMPEYHFQLWHFRTCFSSS